MPLQSPYIETDDKRVKSSLERMKNTLRRVFGIDRAIAYTVIARGGGTLGSVGTVLLLVHFLTGAQQGYYYTLLSLVALQQVFELGFSVVILQMAAHERAHLQIDTSFAISGDRNAHARLASILQKTVWWYSIAAILMLALLLPAGIAFFAKHQPPGAPAEWFWPWCLAVPACIFAFLVNPICSFLEGCGYVPQVAKMRVAQSLIGTTLCWTAMISHHGLFATSAVLFAHGVVGFTFFSRYKRLFIPLLRRPGNSAQIDWGTEVWPFQWRIAVTSLCSYLTALVFTPIVFAMSGAVAAGQFGLSLNIANALLSLILPWITTKAAPFGRLVATGEREHLDRLFFRALQQSTIFFALMLVACAAGIFTLHSLYPGLASRMLVPPLFSLLLATTLFSYILQGEATYLRAHKVEPFLGQSIVVAALTLISSVVLARLWGTAGVVWAYFLFAGVVGLASGTFIFRKKKLAWDSGSL
jgi:O-antigen/teichoic acid export membrane protein